jgi:microcystin-dependent protein
MTTPFLGTIQLFSFSFPPKGWAACNGQLLAITSNQALFSLLGTTYGGDGIRTFALPDLRGRTPISSTPTTPIPLGASAGQEQHTLLQSEMPLHTHQMFADGTTSSQNNTNVPTGAVLGQSGGLGTETYTVNMYSTGVPNNLLAPQSIGLAGNSRPHDNRMPYLVMNFCIALNGIFPSRN